MASHPAESQRRIAAVACDPIGKWPLVWALAVAQLVSWGSLYYSFSLFVVPMEMELGWSRTAINGALSIGLLTAGLCAYPVGAWIDRRGGRAIMALGSALASVVLASWSQVESLGAFYAVWILLGAAMAATLYEPVFAVLTRLFERSYRTRITALTLIGGFASTVFIPLTQLFIEWLGWRDALIALALCNLLIGLPVHALLLRDGTRDDARSPADVSAAAVVSRTALARALRHPVFWGLAVCLIAYYATFSALTFHIIPLLVERGVPTAIIIAAVAVIGPAQVGGRILLLAAGRSLPTAVVGRGVVLVFPASVLLLLTFPTSITALFAFALLYGAANGIMTIIRGTAVPDLMWREGYGAINGALAFPATVAQAAAPFAAALVWSAAGSYGAVLWCIVGGSSIAAIAFWYAAAATASIARAQPTR